MLDNNQKEKILINTARLWKNFFKFQNNGRRRGVFERKDGGRLETNWLAYSDFGASTYHYFRAEEHNHITSAFGSTLPSTLFEYTIECLHPHPIHDIAITLGIGGPGRHHA